jgi:hypothetical protein
MPSSQASVLTTRASLPDNWRGLIQASSEGNPFLDSDGRSVWRLDHVWPDDWRDGQNYHPLIWLGSRWGMEHKAVGSHDKCPSAESIGSTMILGVFASRLDTPKGQAFSNKTPSLSYICNKRGDYFVDASIHMDSPIGESHISLFVLKYKRSDQSIAKIWKVELAASTVNEVRRLSVSCEPGDEIRFVPWSDQPRTGAQVVIENIVISQ